MKNESAGSANFLTIGQLARAVGIHVETIRYYQRIGLMPVPTKPAGSIRRYPQATVQRLYFIRRAKELGFSLKDIRLLLQLDETSCDEARAIAKHKLSGIETSIADLQAIADLLKTLIHQCETDEKNHCPIIDVLNPAKA
jgi:MerR family mercuric resistance operon transcriptional regulator